LPLLFAQLLLTVSDLESQLPLSLDQRRIAAAAGIDLLVAELIDEGPSPRLFGAAEGLVRAASEKAYIDSHVEQPGQTVIERGTQLADRQTPPQAFHGRDRPADGLERPCRIAGDQTFDGAQTSGAAIRQAQWSLGGLERLKLDLDRAPEVRAQLLVAPAVQLPSFARFPASGVGDLLGLQLDFDQAD